MNVGRADVTGAIMQVIRRRKLVQSEDPDHFTGPAVLERYSSVVGGYLATLVTFESGSSTHWHSHPRGQVLYVVWGDGFVDEAGCVTELGEGDVVIADPWSRHRRGAAAEGPMAHLSVT
jgi:4-carboxymuconolactone decarboxylase